MRTLRVKLYKFEELSEAAKQKAIDWWRDGETFDWIYDEAGESLKAFCELFSINLRDYDFNDPHRSRYTFDLEDNILELSGVRLRTYLINNYYSTLFERKPYGEYKKRQDGKWRYDRYSRCQYIQACCPFTGVCYDEDLLDPIRKFISSPTNNDFKDLMEDCLSSLNKSVEGEIEGSSEDASVADSIMANDYEFYEDGSKY